MSLICAIDPGTSISALVTYDPARQCVVFAVTDANGTMVERLRGSMSMGTVLVVEQIESMGMAVGAETFQTVWWAGRFYQAWPYRAEQVTRRQVKLHLCGSMRAKDGNIRQALMDKFGGAAAKGTKKAPGPLYGLKGHEFAALAVAVTYAETTK